MPDSPSSHAPPPTLVSLLICDQVIDDKLTNKKSAIGLFNMIVVPAVPAVVQQIALLASLTEIFREVRVELRLVRDGDLSVLFSTGGPIKAPSPLAVADLVFAVQGVRLPTAGQYAFELVHDEVVLGRRRFQVVVRPPPSQPPAHGPHASPPPSEN